MSWRDNIYRCVECGYEGVFEFIGASEAGCNKLKCPECGELRDFVEMTPINVKPLDIGPEHWNAAEDGEYPY